MAANQGVKVSLSQAENTVEGFETERQVTVLQVLVAQCYLRAS